MSETIRGACLCGRVRFELDGPFDAFHWCHCSQCRRSTGSAHAANLFTDPVRLRWLSGEDLVQRFTPDKPDMISKCFCRHCGSLVPYTSLQSGRLVVPAGSLADDPGIAPDDNIFWRDRAPWYDAGLAAPRVEQEPGE